MILSQPLQVVTRIVSKLGQAAKWRNLRVLIQRVAKAHTMGSVLHYACSLSAARIQDLRCQCCHNSSSGAFTSCIGAGCAAMSSTGSLECTPPSWEKLCLGLNT